MLAFGFLPHVNRLSSSTSSSFAKAKLFQLSGVRPGSNKRHKEEAIRADYFVAIANANANTPCNCLQALKHTKCETRSTKHQWLNKNPQQLVHKNSWLGNQCSGNCNQSKVANTAWNCFQTNFTDVVTWSLAGWSPLTGMMHRLLLL